MSRGGRYQAPSERSILLLIDGSGSTMRSGQPPSREAAQNWQFSIAKKPNENRKKMSNSRLSQANSSAFGKESGSQIKIAQT
jgi:hypothetical protein